MEKTSKINKRTPMFIPDSRVLLTDQLYKNITYLDKRLTMFYRGNKSANLFHRPIFCLFSFMRAWWNQIAQRYSWRLISSTARIITWFSSTSLWWWWTRAQIWNLRIKKLFLSYRVFLPHFLCKVILIERVFELFWEASKIGFGICVKYHLFSIIDLIKINFFQIS